MRLIGAEIASNSAADAVGSDLCSTAQGSAEAVNPTITVVDTLASKVSAPDV